MRLFFASLATETNTFAPLPTGWQAFRENGLTRSASRDDSSFFSPVLVAWRRLAEAEGLDIVEGLSAFAQPGGVTVRSVYEQLRDDLLAGLRAALAEGPVDLVLLALHGAMVAEGYDDCEGDLLQRVRALAPQAAIGAELDLHGHLTPAMLGAADVLVTFKEYPHIDAADRAAELFSLCLRRARRQIRPVAAMLDTRLIGMYPTFEPPMRDLVADLKALEARPPLLSASLVHGFPWADVAEVGTRVLVYADGDGEAAAAAASGFARQLYALRDTLVPRYPGIEASLDRAADLEGPVVLADYADNPGGGAPGDSTFVLRALLARGSTAATIGCFFDPGVVGLCADAGVGARLRVRLGGKLGPSSGDPVDLAVEVLAVRESHDQACFGSRRPLGRSVALRSGGLQLVVCSMRSQVFDPDAFTGLGLSLADQHLVVVKSSSHFEAGFRPMARHLWRMATPGTLTLDLASLPYSRRDGCFHPREADPWAVAGEPQAQIVPSRTDA